MSSLLADITWTGNGLVLPVIAVTLSLTIPIVAIITEHFQKKKKMELVEKAIEHGVDVSGLDLDDEKQARPRLPYRSGMVTTAVGIALLIVRSIALNEGTSFATLITIAGVICLCVGLALLLNDVLNRDRIRPEPARVDGDVDLHR